MDPKNYFKSMKINNDNLSQIIQLTHQSIADPTKLTDRVIQFGTGVLLRGLPDFYIDHANRTGDFEGSIVLVKSTNQGDINAFKEQNNHYTIQTEGIENGEIIQHQQIVTCISKVLTVQHDWDQLVNIAKQPNIEYIISNTTESGIVEVDEDLTGIPKSFPGRLTALLYARFLHFAGNPNNGWIILPTELIDNNADKLKAIVISIATKSNLSAAFVEWIENSNHFCNTLVDRIVPGKVETSGWEYEDELAIAVEPFNLWAIEVKNDTLKEKITFAAANPGIRLMDSIQNIKELKLRLLNATHTLLCPIAIIARHTFVRESLNDPSIENWTRNLMRTEINRYLLTKGILEITINEFASVLIDRFKNPFIGHQWQAIFQNSTQKWIQRVIPILHTWNTLHTTSSAAIALSMACYLKCHQLFNETELALDSQIQKALSQGNSPSDILGQKNIWTVDLSLNSSFVELVTKYMQDLDTKSIFQLIH